MDKKERKGFLTQSCCDFGKNENVRRFSLSNLSRGYEQI